jgi:hypothetical protein
MIAAHEMRDENPDGDDKWGAERWKYAKQRSALLERTPERLPPPEAVLWRTPTKLRLLNRRRSFGVGLNNAG